MFVAFEGLDRAGKSTQLKMLQDHLDANGIKYSTFKYPDRIRTATGPLIDSFLKGETQINWHAASFLLAANLYELVPLIEEAKARGEWILFDRYSYSSMAYSEARGLDAEVARTITSTLPTPDIVFFLKVSSETASQRSDYGAEIFEKKDFQVRVADAFVRMQKPAGWIEVEADSMGAQQVHEYIIKQCMN